ncbi:MAG: FIST signal transduction protein [Candidatus Nanohaloarchaea archaeon]
MGDISVGEGFTRIEEHDGAEAGKKLFADASEGMNQIDFGFLFCSSEFDIEEMASSLQDEMDERDAEWVGVSTAGEISNAGSTMDSAVLLLVGSDGLEFRTAVSRDIHREPVESGREAAREAVDDSFLESDRDRILFALMSGLTQKWEGVEFEILKGITAEIGTDIPMVSEAEGRVIKKISGKPAAEFYAGAIDKDVGDLKKMYDMPLGETLKAMGRYFRLKLKGENPLKIQKIFQYSLENSIAEEISPGNFRVITPLSVTGDNGIMMTSRVEENQSIHVVRGERENIINAARDAFDEMDPEKDNPLFGIVSDCTCRNQLLKDEEKQEEVNKLRSFLGCPVVGFYGYGEIGGKGEEFSTFKNQTVSGFVFTER